MHLKEGSSLQDGRFTIIKVLGQGGFGITYLARNEMLDNLVAVKEFFPKDFCGRDDTSHLTVGTEAQRYTVEKLKERFLKEAKNLAKLNHPGIVRINDVFEDNNTAYYVMEYVEGESLSQMVKRNGPLNQDVALEYVLKIGNALEYVHSKRMTHFDIKPANIMVRKVDNEPILIDFGLAKQYDYTGNATSTVMQGVSHGYSAIELYSGGALETFSPQTDIYSLAATLFNLLTGEVPPVVSQLFEEGLRFPSGVKPTLQQVISKAMSANRKSRHETIREFCEDLKLVRAGKMPSTSASSSDESTQILSSAGGGSGINTADAATRIINTPSQGASKDSPATQGGIPVKYFIIAAVVIVVIAVGVVLLVVSGNDKKATAQREEYGMETSVDANGGNSDTTSAEGSTGYEEASTTTPEVNRDGFEGMILSSPSTDVSGYTVHFYRGSFTLNGRSWPIGIAFVEKNGSIAYAIYRNIQYNATVRMSFSGSGDNVTLSGSQGGSPFIINLYNSYGETLTGTASVDQSFDVDLTPSSQTFSLSGYLK